MTKKKVYYTIGLFILFFYLMHVKCLRYVQYEIEDKHIPLAPRSIHLEGYLDDYIQLSIENWNKGGLPYAAFVDFFRNGRPQFALGEMWGKAVRSGSMLYRYTQDPELKRIMDETVQDLLSTQRENGSISCVDIDKQPEESELWERKYVMLGLQEYYEWVNADPTVLDALKKQADNIISLVGPAPKTEITDVGWSARTTLMVNNETIAVTPGSYAEIKREWDSGDIITLSLDMRCRIIDAPQGSNRDGDLFQAVIRGPVVLARDENMDANYNQPVSLKSKKGYIEAIQEKPASKNIKLQFSLPLENGESITMVDYGSVNNWNNNMHVYTWLPLEDTSQQ